MGNKNSHRHMQSFYTSEIMETERLGLQRYGQKSPRKPPEKGPCRHQGFDPQTQIPISHAVSIFRPL
jgi:hypothetical protein